MAEPSVAGMSTTPSSAPADVARPRRLGRRLLVAGATAGVIALVGVPAMALLYLRAQRGTGDVLIDHDVPASAAIYATVRLDPPLSTKLHIRDLLDRFPDTKGSDVDTQVSRLIRAALGGSGLDFDNDVKPWLGSQIAAVGLIDEHNAGGAALIASKDDDRATAALTKVQSGPAGRDLTWAATNHDGVIVMVGTPAPSSGSPKGTPLAWAVVKHVAVIGSDTTSVYSILDTATGHTPALGTDALYQETMSRLSSDRVAEIYVAAAPLIRALHRSLNDAGPSAQAFDAMLRPLDAYRSGALAVKVTSDHIDVDVLSLTDPKQLPADVTSSGAGDAKLVSWLPQSSLAVVGGRLSSSGSPAGAVAALGALTVIGRQVDTTFSNVSEGLSVASGPSGTITTVPPQPTFAPLLQPPPSRISTDPFADLFGVDAQTLKHLTGPAAGGIWADSDGGSPRGAVLLSADDPTSLHAVLDALLRVFHPSTPTCTIHIENGLEVPICTHTKPTPSVLHDAGADISLLDDGGPAYAIVDSVGIFGSNVQAVRDVVAAHHTGHTVTSAPSFTSASASAAGSGLFWVDIQRSLQAIRAALSPSERASLDGYMPNLTPLRTLTATSTQNRSVQTVHLELVVG